VVLQIKIVYCCPFPNHNCALLLFSTSKLCIVPVFQKQCSFKYFFKQEIHTFPSSLKISEIFSCHIVHCCCFPDQNCALLWFSKSKLCIVIVFQIKIVHCYCFPNQNYELLWFSKSKLSIVVVFQIKIMHCCCFPN